MPPPPGSSTAAPLASKSRKNKRKATEDPAVDMAPNWSQEEHRQRPTKVSKRYQVSTPQQTVAALSNAGSASTLCMPSLRIDAGRTRARVTQALTQMIAPTPSTDTPAPTSESRLPISTPTLPALPIIVNDGFDHTNFTAPKVTLALSTPNPLAKDVTNTLEEPHDASNPKDDLFGDDIDDPQHDSLCSSDESSKAKVDNSRQTWVSWAPFLLGKCIDTMHEDSLYGTK
ncbi:hypothetical protein BDV98DRAFT_608852 [Pterulicium gracile]|uniref:Uncharacterized protein n=1 Tax=Pterulicium gracile TaxID=1884261 RepID=A0A5C3Q192_9AGAR|nr:hypothetical protein BDV98DRAFT_608852 [Pterula gracilis]